MDQGKVPVISDSIFILHSNELGWDTVRHALQTWMPRSAYLDVSSAPAFEETVRSLSPKAVLASDLLDGESSLPLLESLKERFSSDLLVSVFAGDVDAVDIHHYAQLNLNGFYQ